MKSKKTTKNNTWNLSLLYDSPHDPRIDEDMSAWEKAVERFARRYDTPQKKYLTDRRSLLLILRDFEKLEALSSGKFLMYLHFFHDIDSSNVEVSARIALLSGRAAKIGNQLTFFRVALGQIPKKQQRLFLAAPELRHFHVFLSRIFDQARFHLSIPEEKIMSLKGLPAYNMWVDGNQKFLNTKTIAWRGKQLPLAQALGMVFQLPKQKERQALSAAIAKILKEVAPFSEAEINAVVTNKKINDELRGYRSPEENTILGYRNDPAVVAKLIETVNSQAKLAHRFYAIKARLLKLPHLIYADRGAKIGEIKKKFDFAATCQNLKEIYRSLPGRYEAVFDQFLKERRIDVYPRLGKKSGAYCWGAYGVPTFVMLNHTDDFRSFTTAAHEMGHAFHTELSQSQGALYCDYSTALAETASTLFESLAIEKIYDQLSDEEKIIVLHDKIDSDISTIFRQVACFNYEKAIHEHVRSKGFVSHQELAELHNRHMSAYLGPRFRLTLDDGYYFVHWGHIRRFFYVYSYAFGQLVSKALLRRYKQDPSFWQKIEQFLSAGDSDSPENILKSIGLDIASGDFWQEGLREVEADIARLEKLTARKRSV